MVEPTTISLIIGVIILVIDKVYTWAKDIYKSKCCCGEIDRNTDETTNLINK